MKKFPQFPKEKGKEKKLSSWLTLLSLSFPLTAVIKMVQIIAAGGGEGGLMDTLPGTLDPRKWRSSVTYGLSQRRPDRSGGQWGSPPVQSSAGHSLTRSHAASFCPFLLRCSSFTRHRAGSAATHNSRLAYCCTVKDNNNGAAVN